MNTQAVVQPSALPFFDPSAKRITLPRPTASPRPGVHRPTRRGGQHSRTASSDTSSSSEPDLPPRSVSHSAFAAQCYTPEMSRSPSPGAPLPAPPAVPINVPTLALRSPPLTPPTIHATLPPSAPISNYRLRLEPLSTGEPPQAVVVFPDAAAPTRALLLLGPAIARHMRERGGKPTRMHPYRVVFRPTA